MDDGTGSSTRTTVLLTVGNTGPDDGFLELTLVNAGLSSFLPLSIVDRRAGCDQTVFVVQSSVDGRRVVVKRANEERDKIEKQLLMQTRAASAGVKCPVVIYHDLGAGVLVETFMEGEQLTTMHGPSVWRGLGAQLKLLHRALIDFFTVRRLIWAAGDEGTERFRHSVHVATQIISHAP
jgi:hypothetical protein